MKSLGDKDYTDACCSASCGYKTSKHRQQKIPFDIMKHHVNFDAGSS